MSEYFPNASQIFNLNRDIAKIVTLQIYAPKCIATDYYETSAKIFT